MTKLIFLIGLAGAAILAFGIKFQSPYNRRLGLILLGAATLLIILSRVGHIDLVPTTPTPTPASIQQF